jgi:hypothetical protein
VPATMRRRRMQELATRGAEARLRELLEEASSLVRLFPALRDSFDPDELPVPFLLRRGAARAAKAGSLSANAARASEGRRRTRGWTPAQRQAAAHRMKAYWAKRKRRTK